MRFQCQKGADVFCEPSAALISAALFAPLHLRDNGPFRGLAVQWNALCFTLSLSFSLYFHIAFSRLQVYGNDSSYNTKIEPIGKRTG